MVENKRYRKKCLVIVEKRERGGGGSKTVRQWVEWKPRKTKKKGRRKDKEELL